MAKLGDMVSGLSVGKPRVSVDGVDLTDHVSSVTVDLSVDTRECELQMKNMQEAMKALDRAGKGIADSINRSITIGMTIPTGGSGAVGLWQFSGAVKKLSENGITARDTANQLTWMLKYLGGCTREGEAELEALSRRRAIENAPDCLRHRIEELYSHDDELRPLGFAVVAELRIDDYGVPELVESFVDARTMEPVPELASPVTARGSL